ncbi:MAG TPA: carboxypeptidase regulatory-like domain-containing protein [Terriglobia bacterium]|nr:carboxypeptidase regulatory-like domain-containing protein [Terriglobia bacterium]
MTWADRKAWLAALLLLLLLAAARGKAHAQQAPGSAQPNAASESKLTPGTLAVTVLDETKVAVPAAHVTASGPAGSGSCETDYAGRCEIAGLAPGVYELRVEKENYFAALEKNVGMSANEGAAADVTLAHQRELVERVNVIYSAPLIDPRKTTLSNTLDEHDLIDLPYTVDRDLLYSFPLLPGALPDATAQIHVDGSDSPQTIYLLDGFTFNAPESRDYLNKLSVDAVQSVSLETSRYPAEYWGGSGGVLSVNTGMGDDHFRFVGTNFIPGLTENHGIHVGSFYPRFMLTGPLKKGKAWFLFAPQAEYDQAFFTDLPAGQNSIPAWSYSPLAKTQVNVSSSSILTGIFLFNGYGANHIGLSQFTPVPTTTDLRSNHLLALRDQTFLAGGAALEAGFAETAFYAHVAPMGDQTYVLGPAVASGNYFESSIAHSGRLEGIANLIVPVHAAGEHELKFGLNLDRITFSQSLVRNPFEIVRADGTLDRAVRFAGPSALTRDNLEAGAYAEDRWTAGKWLTVSPGVRFDWDEIVRSVDVSPRLAASYLLRRGGDTKLVGGVGIYYDATSIGLLSLPLQGQRLDTFYNTAGTTPLGPPVVTEFQYTPGTLKEPYVINWSGGVERKLPGSIYADFEFLDKRGDDGFAYFNGCKVIAGCLNGMFHLLNAQTTYYHAGRVTARHQFKGDHFIFASYTESRARSNAGLQFSLENPLYGPQLPGPLSWDSPHRFLSWGFLPLVRGYDLAYILDARSGFPFYIVNQNQQLVAGPGADRYHAYFSLDLAAEKRFHLFGYLWALRAGFDNITNRQNAGYVDNNIDSPQFLTFSAVQGRSLTGRIRLLGRK